MGDRLRVGAFAGAVLVIGLGLMHGMSALPPYTEAGGSYGLGLVQVAVQQRNAANAVSAVLFDLRVLDTLGELFALFGGAAAVQMLLREMDRERTTDEPEDRVGTRPVAVTSDAMRRASLRFAAPAALMGGAIVVRGHLSVGGGFQGGVLLASAAVLVFLAGRYGEMTRLTPSTALDAAETIGAAGFATLALAGLVVATAFGANVLPLGRFGDLLSAGTIPVLSVLVGVEASAAVALVVSEYARQALEIEGDGP